VLLIILRGPAAAGKTSIKNNLLRRLGEDAAFLHLDIIESRDNPLSTANFQKMYANALKHKNVVGEMYFGDSHTTDPKWLDEFRKRGYCIVSIVLGVSFDTSYQRWKADPTRNHDEDIRKDYDKFIERQKVNVFGQAAKLEEIKIDTEGKTIDQICDEIMIEVRKICP
jgi:tRNA uridine 5-carbamoylmethylation protein Kti12